MKRIIAFLIVAVLAMPIPGSAQSSIIDIELPGDGTVDLLDNKGESIVFAVHEDEFDALDHAPAQAVLQMRCDCGTTMSRTMAYSSADGTWRATVEADHPDLVVGTWSVEPVGTTTFGQSQRIEGSELTVTAEDDTHDPTLVIRDLNETTNSVKLKANTALLIDAEDELLRAVTYQIEGMPAPVKMQRPYQLGVDSFKTGASNITINATDRAHHVTSLTFTVLADEEDPVVSASVPDVLYDGVPNTIRMVVLEHSNFTVTLRGVNATAQQSFPGDPELQVVSVDITPRGLGSRILEIVVEDDLGNFVRLLEPTRVSLVDVDVHLMDATISGGPVVAGESLRLHVEAQQRSTIIDVPVDVYYGDILLGQITLPPHNATQELDAAGNATGNMTVNSIVEANFTLQLPPGQHTGPVRLVAPDEVNETAPGDESRLAVTEVYLGRVLYGDDRYHIRTQDGSFPSEAVGVNGTTYELRLEDQELTSVYAFDVDGTRLYWDPRSNTTTVPMAESGEDKDSPGFGWLIPVLAAGAILRRRA